MFEHYSAEPVFNVKAVSLQADIDPATLRAWERRYGIPNPSRNSSGYRLYSMRDVAILRWLKAQLQNGLTISKAVALLRSLEAANGHATADADSQARLPASWQRLHDELIAAAMDFDELRIEQTLSEAFALFPVEDVCTQLIYPTLTTIGEMWQAGEVSVSVEHFITNVFRRRLLALMASAPMPHWPGRIVAACAPGELHEMGLLTLALFLRRWGFHVIYLGQSLALARLNEALDKIHPDVALLSASTLPTAASLLETVRHIRTQPGQEQLTVAFGGRIFNTLPILVAHVPAHRLDDDARKATRQIAQWMVDPRTQPLLPAVTLPSLDAQETLNLLRQYRAELTAMVLRTAAATVDESIDYSCIASVVADLLDLIESALIFEEPSVLEHALELRSETYPPCVSPPRWLAHHAQLIGEACLALLPELAQRRLAPYFAALSSGFATTQ
ncbi:MAG: MerR family transcriptional regulator [Thermoflexales bacterium]